MRLSRVTGISHNRPSQTFPFSPAGCAPPLAPACYRLCPSHLLFYVLPLCAAAFGGGSLERSHLVRSRRLSRALNAAPPCFPCTFRVHHRPQQHVISTKRPPRLRHRPRSPLRGALRSGPARVLRARARVSSAVPTPLLCICSGRSAALLCPAPPSSPRHTVRATSSR